MLILLRTSGFLVSATNGLNLLNKKIHFFSFVYFYSSHYMLLNTAYWRLLKELLKRSENQNTQTEPLSSLYKNISNVRKVIITGP